MIVGLRGLAVRFKVLKALFKRKTRFQWFLATISESAFDMKSSISGSTKLPNFEKLFRMKHRKMFSYFKERSNLFQNSYWNI